MDPDNFTPFYDVQLSKALSRLGWEMVWVTSTPQFGQMPQTELTQVERLFFKLLKRPLLRRYMRYRYFQKARRLVKALGYLWGLCILHGKVRRELPGIIHVQWALFPWADRLFWKKWRRQGWGVVYTCHDPLPLKGSLPRHFSVGIQRLCLTADAVIVHGQWSRQTLMSTGISSQKIHVIEPGACTEPYDIKRHMVRPILGMNPTDPIILFFGFIKPYKGLSVLLDSLPWVRAELKKFQLLVVGESMVPVSVYQRRLRRNGLAKLVKWSIGYVSEEESRWYFAASDVVVLPYTEASTSSVLLQAYSAGRPVVASAVGDIPAMVEDQETGVLVPPKDPPALANAIIKVIKDEETARKMGANGRDLLRSRFNWHRAARQTGTLYRKVYEQRFR